MAPKQPPIVLPDGCTADNLRPIQQLLHLTAHRNKNQHRVAKWWASLGILRRQLGRLVAQLEAPDAAFRAKRIEIEQRVGFVREEIVPRCYLAFSAVVADNQYAPLGLMLMGCLARLTALISFPEEEKDEEEEVPKMAAVESHMAPTEDIGQAISREELMGTAEDAKSPQVPRKRSSKTKDAMRTSSSKTGSETPRASGKTTPEPEAATEPSEVKDAAQSLPSKGEKKRKKTVERASTSTSSKPATSTTTKKRRKKGGDAFDDLFSGLV